MPTHMNMFGLLFTTRLPHFINRFIYAPTWYLNTSIFYLLRYDLFAEEVYKSLLIKFRNNTELPFQYNDTTGLNNHSLIQT